MGPHGRPRSATVLEVLVLPQQVIQQLCDAQGVFPQDPRHGQRPEHVGRCVKNVQLVYKLYNNQLSITI